MQTGNFGAEFNAQFRIIGGSGRVEIEPVFRVEAEAELQIESDGNLDVAIHFEAEARHANVEVNRVLRCVEQREVLFQPDVDDQPGVAIQRHVELAESRRFIQRIARGVIHQQIQAAGAERVPERLLDRVLDRGGTIAAGGVRLHRAGS